jgi:hypothetical protein
LSGTPLGRNKKHRCLAFNSSFVKVTIAPTEGFNLLTKAGIPVSLGNPTPGAGSTAGDGSLLEKPLADDIRNILRRERIP